jgi:hypothetical protein
MTAIEEAVRIRSEAPADGAAGTIVAQETPRVHAVVVNANPTANAFGPSIPPQLLTVPMGKRTNAPVLCDLTSEDITF